MDSDQKDLQRQPHELSLVSGIFLTPSQQKLAIEIHLTTLNSKSGVETELLSEFKREFENEPPEAVEWAFRAWRRQSQFFPAISEIATLLGEWHRAEREQDEIRQQLKDKLTEQEARKAGQLVDFREIQEKLLEIVSHSRMSKHERRLRDYRERHRELPVDPPLQFTQQQIEARREFERVEIEKYKHQPEGGVQ